jgi:hypothetical protein
MLNDVTTVVEVVQSAGGTVTGGTVTDGVVTVVGTPEGIGTVGVVTVGNVPDGAATPPADDVVLDRAGAAPGGFEPDGRPATD